MYNINEINELLENDHTEIIFAGAESICIDNVGNLYDDENLYEEEELPF